MLISKKHLEALGFHVELNEREGTCEVHGTLTFDPEPLHELIAELVQTPEYRDAIASALVGKIHHIQMMEAIEESARKIRQEEARNRNAFRDAKKVK